MYAVFVIALSAWLAYISDGLVTHYRELSQMYQEHARAIQTRLIAEALDQYVNERGEFPLSLTALATTPGFEYVRGLYGPWQGYDVTTGLTDSVWRYSRMTFFTTNPKDGISRETYLGQNSCGTGPFSSATSWCGSPGSSWYRRESKDSVHNELANQRIRLHRTLQKLAQHYNSHGAFPAAKSDGSVMSDGSIQTLADIVGFSSALNDCIGAYAFESVPLDCVDLYDQWGGKIEYQLESDQTIVLLSRAPVFNAAGTQITVAATYDLSLL
ncbi:hypothetical protein [Castellaniella sp.]|uniref:hypothetical protein n=1 Tax=Castellaniella sp. TaxID=1955812 RepID=UPI002AFED45C|nr:hypothetical protein [Castellaniella sp.]